MANCKGCGAKIIWAETVNGKNTPLDAEPKKMYWLKTGIAALVDVYMPHWATCPKAKDFKRG